MEFIVHKNDLVKLVALCRAATDVRSTLPTGDSILFTAAGSRLEGYSTLVSLSVMSSVPAKVKTSGSVVLNAARLRAMVKQMPDGGQLKLKVDGTNQRATLTCSGSKLRYQMTGQSQQDFPAAPVRPIEAQDYQFPGKLLREALTRVRGGIGEAGRSHLWGISLDTSEKHLRSIAVHGHKVFSFEQSDDFQHAAGRLFITEPSLSPILALCDGDNTVQVTANDRHVFCAAGDTMVASVNPDNVVRDWTEVLESMMSDNIVCRVDVDILLQAVRAVTVTAADTKGDERSPALQLEVVDKLLKIKLTNTADEIDADHAIEVDPLGTMKIMCEAGYFIEALEAAGGGIAELRYSGDSPTDPATVRSDDGFSGFLALRN